MGARHLLSQNFRSENVFLIFFFFSVTRIRMCDLYVSHLTTIDHQGLSETGPGCSLWGSRRKRIACNITTEHKQKSSNPFPTQNTPGAQLKIKDQ